MATVEKVLALYREKYFDLNVQHFHEKLQAEHGIDFPLVHGNAEAVPRPDASFDFAISEGMHIEKVKTLQQAGSDHLPVLVEARVKSAVLA